MLGRMIGRERLAAVRHRGRYRRSRACGGVNILVMDVAERETELHRDDSKLAAKVTQTQAFHYPRS